MEGTWELMILQGLIFLRGSKVVLQKLDHG
jgi:hypothetical protein